MQALFDLRECDRSPGGESRNSFRSGAFKGIVFVDLGDEAGVMRFVGRNKVAEECEFLSLL